MAVYEYGLAVGEYRWGRVPKEMPAVVRASYDRYRELYPGVGWSGDPVYIVGPVLDGKCWVGWYEQVERPKSFKEESDDVSNG